MGLFSSKTKTYYSSQHIAFSEMDKHFQPYINGLVMSTALRTDRYISSTDVLKEGIYNSPTKTLLDLINFQAKELGATSELYISSQNYQFYDFSNMLGLNDNQSYEIQLIEDTYFDAGYFALDWISKNRPELLDIRDKIQVEYIQSQNAVMVIADGERFTVYLPEYDKNSRVLFLETVVTTNSTSGQIPSKSLIRTTSVGSIPSSYMSMSKISDSNKEVITPVGTEVLETFLDIEENAINTKVLSHTFKYVNDKRRLREVVYESREVTEEEYEQGITGKRIEFSEIVRTREVVSTKKEYKYINIKGRLARRLVAVTTTTEVPFVEIIRKEFLMFLTNEVKETRVLVYQYGSGNPTLDTFMGSRQSLGIKVNPLLVKQNNSLISNNHRKDVFEYNNKCISKFSGNTTDYSEIFKNLEGDSLASIKEAILIFGVPLGYSTQFAIEYGYYFFKTVLDSRNIIEGSLNMNGICKQIYGNLHYDPGIGNVTRKVLSGVPSDDLQIGKVYRKTTTLSSGFLGRSSSAYLYTLRTSDSQYVEITVGYSGQTAMSTAHWDIHGISHADNNTNAGSKLPILESVIRNMPLAYSMDIPKYCMSIILTTYEQVKVRWYQRGIFKVVIAVIMIAVAIFFPPAGGAMTAVAGTLGASVATYMALTGLSYLVVANAINVVIGMVIAEMVSTVVNKFIGGALGNLITSLVSSYLTGGILKGNFSLQFDGEAFTKLFKLENLLSLNNASKVINIYSEFTLKKGVKELKEQEAHIESIQDRIKEVQEKYKEDFTNTSMFSTDFLLESINQEGLPSDIITQAEVPSAFIGRSLMVGSDIVDMSLSVVYDYTALEMKRKSFIPEYDLLT